MCPKAVTKVWGGMDMRLPEGIKLPEKPARTWPASKRRSDRAAKPKSLGRNIPKLPMINKKKKSKQPPNTLKAGQVVSSPVGVGGSETQQKALIQAITNDIRSMKPDVKLPLIVGPSPNTDYCDSPTMVGPWGDGDMDNPARFPCGGGGVDTQMIEEFTCNIRNSKMKVDWNDFDNSTHRRKTPTTSKAHRVAPLEKKVPEAARKAPRPTAHGALQVTDTQSLDLRLQQIDTIDTRMDQQREVAVSKADDELHALRAELGALQNGAAPSELVLKKTEKKEGAAIKNSHSREYLQHLFSFRGPSLKDQGCQIAATEFRGITVPQLNMVARFIQLVLSTCTLIDDNQFSLTKGEWVNWDIINMYHISDHFIRPLTAPFQCSFVELIAEEPQPPVWFLSHAWSAGFRNSLSMVKYHTEVHELGEHTPYWYCAFANNQHTMESLSGPVQEMPFWKVMDSDSCEGLLQLMDKDCTPHTRSWCLLEVYCATAALQKKFEVIAMSEQPINVDRFMSPASTPVLRDHVGNEHCQALGHRFPSMVAELGIHVVVEQAEASQPEDHAVILRILSGIETTKYLPPSSHAGYDRVNNSLRQLWAGTEFGSKLCTLAAAGDMQAIQDLVGLMTGIRKVSDGIDFLDEKGQTPLFSAAQGGHVDVVRFLSQNGADMNIRRTDGYSALLVAAQRESAAADVVQVLIECGAAVDHEDAADGCSAAFIAVRDGLVAPLHLLHELGADIQKPHPDGTAPIHVASQRGHAGVLQVLLDYGDDMELLKQKVMLVNQPDKHGMMPICKAAKAGHEDVVRLLAGHGAHLEQPRHNSFTPLLVAVREGHAAVVLALAESKADLNAADQEGFTPVFVAAGRGRDEVVRVLSECGADVNQTNRGGCTPVFIAAQEGHEAAVRVLVEKGADVNIADTDGATPVCKASDRGHGSIVQVLASLGANVNQPMFHGATPLCIAALAGHAEVVQILAENGADVNTATNAGTTPVLIAAQENHEHVMRVLLSERANVNMANNKGVTPLHAACAYGHKDVVKQLIASGASVDRPDRDGNTALQCCADQELVEILLSAAQIQSFVAGRQVQFG